MNLETNYKFSFTCLIHPWTILAGIELDAVLKYHICHWCSHKWHRGLIQICCATGTATIEISIKHQYKRPLCCPDAGPSQQQVVLQALAMGSLEAAAVTHLQLHGTGTLLGTLSICVQPSSVFFWPHAKLAGT